MMAAPPSESALRKALPYIVVGGALGLAAAYYFLSAPKPAAKVVLSSEAAPKTADKSEWLVGTPAAAKAAKAKKAA